MRTVWFGVVRARKEKKNSDNLLFYKTNIFRSRPARKTLEKQTNILETHKQRY